MIKKFGYISFIVFILFTSFYFVSNSIDYFDPIEPCYIKIQGDVLKGEEGTIRKALAYLRSTEPLTYQAVCKYVDKIVENTCLTSDPHFGYPDTIPNACFIKGSKTIYLWPNENVSDTTVKTRAKDIASMAQKSKKFWD